MTRPSLLAFAALSTLLSAFTAAHASARAQAELEPATRGAAIQSYGTPCTPATTTTFNGAGGPIADLSGGVAGHTVFTINVSGLDPYLWDLDVTTFVSHVASGDLEMRVFSPAGTEVVLTRNWGGGNDDVFNGTLWDDDPVAPLTTATFVSLVPETPLNPETSLDRFRGENPNGAWKLDILDELGAGQAGTLNSWRLDLTTLTSAPFTPTTVFTYNPNLMLVDPGTVADTQAVSGVGTTLVQLVLYTEITHTWCNDLDIFLTSPAGTQVMVTTDNASNFDNCYNGTAWDDRDPVVVFRYPFANGTPAALVAPEGSFAGFMGENPNGNWTLTITDDTGVDSGFLVRWDLRVTTCGSAAPPVVYCTSGTTTNGCLASINATANPSVSGGTSCAITVSNVEGQKSGIVFYGLLSNPQPWAPGSTSFLCVKPPTQRTGAQNAGGTAGACNGTLALAWDAFQAANPTALGQPWAVGNMAYVQGWFRDPPAVKTTNLSNAVELTYLP